MGVLKKLILIESSLPATGALAFVPPHPLPYLSCNACCNFCCCCCCNCWATEPSRATACHANRSNSCTHRLHRGTAPLMCC